MRRETQSGYSPGIQKPLAVRALRKSLIRRRITEYLFDISPNSSYTSEIAHHLKTTPSNVIGAIRGMNKRYREDESLIYLDIVEEHHEKNFKMYKITDFGKELLTSLKE